MTRKPKTWLLVMISTGWGGCVQAEDFSPAEKRVATDEHAGAPTSTLSVDADARKHLIAVARDYVYKKVEGHESLAIRQRIRELSVEEATVFHEILGELNGYRDEDRLIFDAMFEEAQAQGKSFLDLTEEDRARALHRLAKELQSPP